MGQGDKRGPNTPDTVASARTLPSGDIDPLSSADTVLAPEAPSLSNPRLPREGGEVLGNRYEILGELGRGGEGVVYRARDLKADAIVALKLLQQDEGSSARLQRFRRELQMARKVTHPNVVRIHDLVELPGRFGLSMELVEGQPLDARLEGEPLTPEELGKLAVDLARALAAAHEAGVTHRDLKPANVLLRAQGGHAVVTDFGVSRAHGGSTPVLPTKDLTPLNLTREGTIIGTPQYMAPEQLEGRIDIGPPADVYAFGLLMYEAATRERPHAATTFAELRRRRATERPAPLREKRPDLPRQLCDVVDRALESEPGRRFGSGAELLAALEPPASTARSRAGLALVALVVAVVGLAVVGVLAMRRAPAVVAPAPAMIPPPPSTPPLDPKVANLRRITSGDGCEEFPHFAPDGQSVVYDETVGRDAFVYQLDLAPGAAPRQITQVHGWDIAPSVSPDGKTIAFVRFEGERVAAYVAPLDGSALPRFVARGSVRPSWTRDGKAIWAGSGSPLAAYDVNTGAIVSSRKGAPMLRTAQTVELAGGDLVTLMTLDEAMGRSAGGVAVFPADGTARWLFRGDVDEDLTVTADGRHVLYARKRAATSVELVDQPTDGSPETTLAGTGISPRKGIALSPDDSKIAWSACVDVPQIIGFDATGKLRRAVDSDMPEVSFLAAVPGTSQVVVVATRGGKPEPWLVGLATDALPQPLPVGPLAIRDVAVSHDGAKLALSVTGDGLYAGGLRDGSPLRRLTFDGTDATPAFRAGDAQIVFTRHAAGAPAVVMMVPFLGGEPVSLLGSNSDAAGPSPRGEQIVYLLGASMAEEVPEVWDGHASRPLSSQLPLGRYGSPRFSPDGRRVALVRGDAEIVEVDVATGAIVRSLATPTGDQLADPTYTPAGLVALRVRFQGNLWMADVTRR